VGKTGLFHLDYQTFPSFAVAEHKHRLFSVKRWYSIKKVKPLLGDYPNELIIAKTNNYEKVFTNNIIYAIYSWCSWWTGYNLYHKRRTKQPESSA
jgi:hypothetical protein